MSRLRLWVWVVGIRVVWVHRRGCGSWLLVVVMAFRGSLRIVDGIWTLFMILILIVLGLVMRVREGSFMMRESSTQGFLGSVRVRLWRWIPSSAYCWKARGRLSRTPVSTRGL